MFGHTARFARWRPGRDRRSAPAHVCGPARTWMPASAN